MELVFFLENCRNSERRNLLWTMRNFKYGMNAGFWLTATMVMVRIGWSKWPWLKIVIINIDRFQVGLTLTNFGKTLFKLTVSCLISNVYITHWPEYILYHCHGLNFNWWKATKAYRRTETNWPIGMYHRGRQGENRYLNHIIGARICKNESF